MAASTIVQNQRDQRDQQIADQLSQSASLNPFQDGQQALEDSIKELHRNSEEYKRLATQADRDAYDAQVRANAAREATWKANRETAATVARDGEQAEHLQRMQYLYRQLESIQIPTGSTKYTMPQGALAQLSKTVNEWEKLRQDAPELNLPAYDISVFDRPVHPLDYTQALAQQARQQPTNTRPQAFDDGRFSHITKNADGSVVVEFASGETFKGDIDSVLENAGKSFAHTKAWGRQYRDLAQQAQTQPQQMPTQIPAQLPDNPTQAASIADFWAQQQSEALARRYGFSGEAEMVDHFAKLKEQGDMMENHAIASSFMAAVPSFPNTDEACNAIAQIVSEQGWQFTPEAMEAAHNLAVRRGMYQELPPEAIEAANGNYSRPARPQAPPMINSSQTPETLHNTNPWTMDLAQLRAEAIRQQLEGRG